MFIYKEEEEEFKLHPCVEINMRMTMGYVAHQFYDHFVQTEVSGRFYVDHNQVSGALWEDHKKRAAEFPLIVENGRIKTGYLSLTEVQPHSNYRVRVELK